VSADLHCLIKTCDYLFYNNLNNLCTITIFGTLTQWSDYMSGFSSHLSDLTRLTQLFYPGV